MSLLLTRSLLISLAFPSQSTHFPPLVFPLFSPIFSPAWTTISPRSNYHSFTVQAPSSNVFDCTSYVSARLTTLTCSRAYDTTDAPRQSFLCTHHQLLPASCFHSAPWRPSSPTPVLIPMWACSHCALSGMPCSTERPPNPPFTMAPAFL